MLGVYVGVYVFCWTMLDYYCWIIVVGLLLDYCWTTVQYCMLIDFFSFQTARDPVIQYPRLEIGNNLHHLFSNFNFDNFYK